MKISKDEVRYVAKLSRLDIDEAEMDDFADKINTILEYVKTLDQVDTQNISATSHAAFATHAFRSDELKESLSNEAALENAPRKDAGYFIVPKVIPQK